MVGAFNSFTFKVIIDIYVPIAIFLIVKGTYIVKKYKRRKKDLQNQSQTINKMAIGTYISITTLNVNGLNVPTKGHRLAEWIQK